MSSENRAETGVIVPRTSIKRITKLSSSGTKASSRYEILSFGPWFEGKATGLGSIVNGEVYLYTPTLDFIGLSPEQVMADLIALGEDENVQFNPGEYKPYDSFYTPEKSVKLESI